MLYELTMLDNFSKVKRTTVKANSKEEAINTYFYQSKDTNNYKWIAVNEVQAMYEQTDSDVKCTDVKEAFKYEDVQCYHVDNKLSNVVVINGIHIRLGSIDGWEGMLDIDLGEMK